jgi:phage terminase large subunit-like protein
LFFSAPQQYVGLFGGIGNGKTFAACVKIADLMAKSPDNLGLIGRLTYPELRDSTKEVFMSVLRKLYPANAYTENKAENSIQLWNKSTIIFRHLDNQASLLGANLGAFLIDQAEEVDQEAFETLQGRLRRQNVGELKGLVVGNPRGHDWVYEKFGMKDGWNEFRHEKDWIHGQNYRMITAPTSANQANLPENYVEQLRESYSNDWFNRYVLGSWDGFEEQIFRIEKIRGYDTLPTMLMVLTACDPAISEKDEACNTAFCTLGIGADGFIYDIETIAGHWPFIEQINQAAGIVERLKTTHFGVEDVGYQRALSEAIRLSHPTINVHNLKADRDKIRRAKSVSHIIASGKFRTNNKDLLDEMISFEPTAKGKAKRDRVDSMVHCFHMVQDFAPIPAMAEEKPLHMKFKTSAELFMHQVQEQEKREMQGVELEEQFGELNFNVNPEYY